MIMIDNYMDNQTDMINNFIDYNKSNFNKIGKNNIWNEKQYNKLQYYDPINLTLINDIDIKADKNYQKWLSSNQHIFNNYVKEDENNQEYYIEDENNNEYHNDDDNNANYIGIPIDTPNTFYSDFIGQNTNYINITDDNYNIVFNKIIKRNNKYYINTNYGTLYVGNDINSLIKLSINNVYIFDISLDGNYLVYSVDNVVFIYNFKTNQNKEIANIQLNICYNENNKYIKQIMFTPDNSRLIFCQNEHIYIWNIKQNKLDEKINMDVINFTADNNYILISHYDKFSVYDINTRNIIFNKTFSDSNIIKQMKIVDDNFIIGFIDGSICMMNINTTYEKFFMNNYAGIKDIAFSDNNIYMASIDNDNVLSVFNIKTKTHIYSLNEFRVSSISLTNNLDIIGSGHFNSISHFIFPFKLK